MFSLSMTHLSANINRDMIGSMTVQSVQISQLTWVR